MIGYVLKRFPTLSQTFVLKELLELERQGLDVAVCSLLPSRDPHVHPERIELSAPVNYIPGIDGFDRLRVIASECRQKYGESYRRLWWRSLFTLGIKGIWRLWQAAAVVHWAEQNRVSHLHVHFAGEAAEAARMAATMMGIGYSITVHAFDIYRKDNVGQALLRQLNDAKFIVTISQSNVDYLLALAPNLEGQIHLVRNGIEAEQFLCEEKEAAASGPLRIISVARLVKKKGLDTLIEACALLKKKDIDFTCAIIGSGPERRHLLTLIERYDLGKQVELHPAMDHSKVRESLCRADIFVLPCRVAEDGDRDGLPVVITEAMASGLPVISTPINGIPEVLFDGENGLLVEADNPEAISSAVEQLLDESRRVDMGNIGRKTVKNLFDLHSETARLKQILESL